MKKLLLSLVALSFLSLAGWAGGFGVGNDLTGFWQKPVGGGTPTVSFQACTTNISNLTTYTFSAAAIGTASATRRVIVGVTAEDGLDDFTLSSATIGGVSATSAVSNDMAFAAQMANIISAAVPTGTTGDVVLTFSESITSAHICVYAVYDLNSGTATATANATAFAGDPVTISVNTQVGGIAIGTCVDAAPTATVTWTGLTETTTEAQGEHTQSSAHLAVLSASTPLSITCDGSGTGDFNGASAHWR